MKKIACVLSLIFVSAFASASSVRTYNLPQASIPGSGNEYIFVTATNGSGFCVAQTGNTRDRIVDGQMMCGEDESSYAAYDFSSRTFFRQSTGSKNQCYPIFRSITCRHF
ncbi:hypothetical protein [Agarilytica rhodophyticola]|uniref:hypothetical protein n=1 Tax=Agarilytica rhodophyticola TaxID=1737490 RepID=UPI000B349848|nr:hypothetical protein [Agarilytica rhodophyticola]